MFIHKKCFDNYSNIIFINKYMYVWSPLPFKHAPLKISFPSGHKHIFTPYLYLHSLAPLDPVHCSDKSQDSYRRRFTNRIEKTKCFISEKKISKILTINILYELTSYFCNMFHFFQYVRRCIYMTFVIRFYSLCTCLHFPSQYIACFLYKDHVEKVHLYVKQISRNIIL